MSKPRFGARVDDTQPAIVHALKEAGAEVRVLDVSRKGVPDLLVGFLGVLYLLENKSSGGRLSKEQRQEHEAWARVGVKVATCRTPREALDAIGLSIGEILRRREAMAAIVPAEKKRKDLNERRLRPSVKRFAP